MTNLITAKKLKKVLNVFTESLITFLFKDFAFIVLPLVVLLIANLFFGKMGMSLLARSSSFSFVNVILMAVSHSNFLELKISEQKDYSFRLFYGARFNSILVILAVVVLVFAIILENNNVEHSIFITPSYIFTANVTLFFIGAYSIFMDTLYTVFNKSARKNFDEPKNSNMVIGYLDESISITEQELDYSLFVLNNFTVKKKDRKNYDKDDKLRMINLENKMNELDTLLTNVKKQFALRKDDLL